ERGVERVHGEGARRAYRRAVGSPVNPVVIFQGPTDGGDMVRYIRALLGALVLATAIVAQPVAQAQTAQSVLQTAAKAMGSDTVKCLTYSSPGGAGICVGIVGQGFSPADDWPKVELASFTRVINYDAKTMREEQVRRQGNYPQRGGGGIPIQGEQRQVSLVNGNYAWGLQGTTVNPQPAAAE